jgi:L-lactate dehydrogenase (cytochrome)
LSIFQVLRSVVRFRPPEWRPDERRIRRIANVDDARNVARRQLPRGVFDYIDGAAESERTARANTEAYARLRLNPRVLRNVATVDPSTTVLGSALSYPLILAPTGFTRIAHSSGELAVARAAARAGVAYSLASMGTYSIEQVAAVCDGPKWFQLYWWRDRGLTSELLRRAAASGFEVLWLTVDTPVIGRRERDIRRGFSIPPKIGPATILDGIVHPEWTLDFLRHDPIVFANVAGRRATSDTPTADGSAAMEVAKLVMRQFDPSCSWSDLDWIKSQWPGPIVLKGIVTPADAARAVEAGMDAVAVSNHGGRQLDDVGASIERLEAVVEAVAGQAAVIADGGIRRGSDVVKALALGADACSIGRPYLYGLGAAGERGVDHILELLGDGVSRTMALLGCTTVSEIGREHVSWV